MSDDLLFVIPTDPWFRPTSKAAKAVAATLRGLAPGSQEINTVGPGRLRFIDAAENFESIRCPKCQLRIEIDWWTAKMSKALDDEETNLMIRTPCCKKSVSLNDLEYEWPQGFACWWVEAMNYDRGLLDDRETALLAKALGHDVRIVYAHI
jgi:hypothetical protein